MEAYEELFKFARMLDDAANAGDADNIVQPLSALENAANQVNRSFSGSWLGYHSRVYYDGLVPAPPGAHFSPERGLQRMAASGLAASGESLIPKRSSPTSTRWQGSLILTPHAEWRG